MKRLLISILATTLLTPLSGCNGNFNSNSTPAENESNFTSNTRPVGNESSSSSNTPPVNNESNYTTHGNDAPQEKQVFYGEWTIKRPVAYGKVCALSDEDIKQLLGKKLYYNSDSVTFEGNVLKNPYYQIEDVNERDFFTFNYVSFKQLGIPSRSIAEIHVYTDKDFQNEWYYTNSDNEGAEIFIKDKNTLMMVMGGVYFELIRNS